MTHHRRCVIASFNCQNLHVIKTALSVIMLVDISNKCTIKMFVITSPVSCMIMKENAWLVCQQCQHRTTWQWRTGRHCDGPKGYSFDDWHRTLSTSVHNAMRRKPSSTSKAEQSEKMFQSRVCRLSTLHARLTTTLCPRKSDTLEDFQ